MEEFTSLKDKVILVSGGTSGIGRATAVLLAKEGAVSVIFGRDQKKLNDTLYDIKKSGGRCSGIIADVSKIGDIKKVFKYIDQEYGKIDVLVNNAAEPSRSIIETSLDEIKYNLEVNLIGYLYCAKLAAERMEAQESGHIVNIGSMSSVTTNAGTDLYVAAKSGIHGFNESFRKCVNGLNIKTTLIEPGSVGTGMAGEDAEQQKKMQGECLMLKAEDIADAVLFALTRPKRCEIISIQLKPFKQNI